MFKFRFLPTKILYLVFFKIKGIIASFLFVNSNLYMYLKNDE